MRRYDFKPGDIAWLTDWDAAPYRKPVLIVRRAMCKDFSPWMRRSKSAEGITYARQHASMSWLVLDGGMQRIEYEMHLYKRQYKPRRPK